MSAIAGIVHFDDRLLERAEIERMHGAIAPLGRDKKFVSLERHAGFISRISIFTAEDRLEQQAVKLVDGSVLVFDGRLDNRDELQPLLGINAAEARLLADSALAARAWHRWQRDCLGQLVGDFAVAHWNNHTRELTLARSAPRGRPLFVHRRGKSLYFASTPAALFALPQIPRALDEAALGDMLLRTRPLGESLFAGISMVRSSHWELHTSAGTKSHCYWRIDPERRLTFQREEDAWEELRPLFAKITASQLRSVHPIGIQMSGGLDSAAVAGQAATLLAETSQRLRTYTHVPGPDMAPKRGRLTYYDERPRVALIVQQHPRLEPTFVHSDNESVLDDLPQFFNKTYAAFAVSPTYVTSYEGLYKRAVADGIRVLLHGSFGNYSLSWDGLPRLRVLFETGRWWTLARELRALNRFRGTVRDVVKREIVRSLLPPAARDRYFGRRNRDTHPWSHFSSITREFAQQSGALTRLRERANIKLHWKGLDAWQQRAWAFEQDGGDWFHSLQERHGMDFRDPTRDRRLIDFCMALPLEFFLKDGIERRLARRGMAHLIPQALCMDPSSGIQDADWAARMKRDAPAIERAIESLESDSNVCRYLDVTRMKSLWQHRSNIDWSRAPMIEVMRYKQALLGCLAVGQYVRWFEGKN